MSVGEGILAPGITLPAAQDERLPQDAPIADEPPNPVVYPGDRSGVSTRQLTWPRWEIPASSADTARSHLARTVERGIRFPLLSYGERSAIDDPGVRRGRGHAERDPFDIDREGVVRAGKVEASTRDQPEQKGALGGVEQVLQRV